MSKFTQFFATRWGIISAGVFVGTFAPLLQRWGNPGNMGICVACMERDIAGALGLHRAATAQYIRPEEIGYEEGARIAKKAYLQNKTIRKVAEEEGLYSKEELNRLLDPQFMIAPVRTEKKEKVKSPFTKEDIVSLFLPLQGKEQDDSPNDHKG